MLRVRGDSPAYRLAIVTAELQIKVAKREKKHSWRKLETLDVQFVFHSTNTPVLFQTTKQSSHCRVYSVSRHLTIMKWAVCVRRAGPEQMTAPGAAWQFYAPRLASDVERLLAPTLDPP